MRPILPSDAALIDQADISFMNERSRLECMVGALSPQTPTWWLSKRSRLKVSKAKPRSKRRAF